MFDEQVSASDNHVEFRGTFEIDRELINFHRRCAVRHRHGKLRVM